MHRRVHLIRRRQLATPEFKPCVQIRSAQPIAFPSPHLFPQLTPLPRKLNPRIAFRSLVKNPISFLRAVGLVEGVSFLILLGIAMPLKYAAGISAAVKWTGWAHGVLFMIFGLALLRAMRAASWPLGRAAFIFIAALIPFGPFVIDRRMREYEAELSKRPGPATVGS